MKAWAGKMARTQIAAAAGAKIKIRRAMNSRMDEHLA